MVSLAYVNFPAWLEHALEQAVESNRYWLSPEFEWVVLGVLAVLVLLLVEICCIAALALMLAGGILGRAGVEFLHASMRAPSHNIELPLMQTPLQISRAHLMTARPVSSKRTRR